MSMGMFELRNSRRRCNISSGLVDASDLQLRCSSASSKYESEEKRSTKLWQRPKNPTKSEWIPPFSIVLIRKRTEEVPVALSHPSLRKKSSRTAKAQKKLRKRTPGTLAIIVTIRM
jgi:hypothetical protein